MDSLVGAIVAMLFGGIGAGVIWIFNKGKTPYKEILNKHTIASDIVGVLVIFIVGISIYLLKK